MNICLACENHRPCFKHLSKNPFNSFRMMKSSRIALRIKQLPSHMYLFTLYLQSCKERSGTSSVTIVKYVMKKYPSVEMDKKTKNLYKRALKRMVEKGTVKQVICNSIHAFFSFFTQTKSYCLVVFTHS